MSLWLQAVTAAIARSDYENFRQLLTVAPIPIPPCVVREAEYGERRCAGHPEERLFPIRALWMFDCSEQRMIGRSFNRSMYHPEKLWESWQRVVTDASFRSELERNGFRFDLESKAMEMTAGWIYIGDSFVDDFLEIERALGVELLFQMEEAGERVPAFREIKRERGPR